jgi:hypothetical protein
MTPNVIISGHLAEEYRTAREMAIGIDHGRICWAEDDPNAVASLDEMGFDMRVDHVLAGRVFDRAATPEEMIDAARVVFRSIKRDAKLPAPYVAQCRYHLWAAMQQTVNFRKYGIC